MTVLALSHYIGMGSIGTGSGPGWLALGLIGFGLGWHWTWLAWSWLALDLVDSLGPGCLVGFGLGWLCRLACCWVALVGFGLGWLWSFFLGWSGRLWVEWAFCRVVFFCQAWLAWLAVSQLVYALSLGSFSFLDAQMLQSLHEISYTTRFFFSGGIWLFTCTRDCLSMLEDLKAVLISRG